MEVTRRRTYLRAFSLLTMGFMVFALWQGSALAVDGEGVTEATDAAADVATDTAATTADPAVGTATETADAVTEETTDTATATAAAVTEQSSQDVAPEDVEAPEVAVTTEVADTNEVTDTTPVETANDPEDGSSTSSSGGASTGTAPSETDAPPTTSVSSSGTRPYEAQAEVPASNLEQTFVLSMRKKLQGQTDQELDSLIAAGDSVQGPIVLGDRIESTSSRSEGTAQPSTSGELAFTGSDLGSFVVLAAVLLMLGSKAARKRRVAPRYAAPTRPVTHLRFAG